MNSKFQVLLDLGGTHTKLQIWTGGALVSQETHKSPSLRRGPRGEATIDPNEFSDHVRSVLTSVPSSSSSSFEIAISSQMACFVLVTNDGAPFSEIVSWQDERCSHPDESGLTRLEKIASQLDDAGIQLWDGLRSGLPLCYLSDILSHQKPDGQLHLMSLAQFAILSIFPSLRPGRIRIHSSEAASTGLYDPINSCWSESIITLFGLDVLTLPEVTSSFERIDEAINVYVPLGDFQAAIAGCSVLEDELFIHIATGGQVARRILHLDYVTNKQHGANNLQVRPSTDANHLIITRTHLPAGRLLASLSGLLDLGVEQQFWNFVDATLLQPCTISAQFVSDNNYELSISKLSPRGIDPEEMVTSIVQALHSVYVDAAKELELFETSGLVFSGGTLTKLPIFRRKFEEYLGLRQARQFMSHDTSLQGLANLMSVTQ